MVSKEQEEALNGILNMIDSIQDAIVRDGFRTEEEVFNVEVDAPEYVNYYKCPNCGEEWEDEWDCEVEDECPNCGTRHITPYKSEEVK